MKAAQILAETPSSDSPFPSFVLTEWWGRYRVVAGITGASGGFDLGLWGTRSAGETERAWESFRESFGERFRKFAVGKQVHGKAVEVWGEVGDGLTVREGKDGHATARRGILLNVLVADCVPVYLLEPKSGSIALLHAGWRGIAAGVLSAGVERVSELNNAKRNSIVMHCGVSICGECYEVGSEVMEAVVGEACGCSLRLDLRAALVRQASELGIERVTVSPFCTLHDEGRFHSFRGQGERSGRMAAYLGVPLS